MDICNPTVTQDRLFRLAPEDLLVTAHFIPREGWQLMVCVRRGDELWPEAHKENYTHLATDELLQVLWSDLEAALGL